MTLARLQRLLTFTLLLFALGWAAAEWHHGASSTAGLGALLVVSGYALVLGLEFVLMAAVNRNSHQPRANVVELILAWSRELMAAPRVFCWRQPFRSNRWPDHLPDDASGRRPVLLVHGFVCNRGLWLPQLQRLSLQGTPYIAVTLEPPFGSIDDYIAPLEAAVARLERCTDRAPLVVAHSMGGLAVRRWRAEPGNTTRLDHVITIGTPHRGTWLARFGFSRNGREMRPDSRWLRALEALEMASGARDFSDHTCFWGHCDNIVFPASSAQLPGADNRHIAATAHVCMADHADVTVAIGRWLEQSGEPKSLSQP